MPSTQDMPLQQPESDTDGDASRLQSVIERLMASSDLQYGQQGLSESTIDVIRELVFRLASIGTPLATIPSVAYFWYRGYTLLAWLDTLLSVVLVAHVWLLLTRNVRIFTPLLQLGVSFLLFMFAVFLGQSEFIYWGFAFPPAIYLLIDKPASLYLNGLWWLLCSAVALSLLPTLEAVNFLFCLASISFFTGILYSVLNRNEESLKQLAARDPLTNTYNRRHMMEALGQALAKLDRYHSPCSIIMIDLDRFKAINDAYGHGKGDSVLKNLVRLLNQRLRRCDKLCRYGGEEFIAILEGVTLEQATRAAELICQEVRESDLADIDIATTVSCGVAEALREETIDTWLHRCDLALYKAKASGRDCVEVAV